MGSLNLARASRDIKFSIPAAFGGGTLSCMLARGVGKDGRKFRVRRVAVPAEEGQQKRIRETARTYSEWVRGAGFGKAGAETEGGFNYGTRLYARSRGMLMPAGEVTEIPIPSGTVSLNSAFDLAGYTWLTAGNRKMIKVTNNGTSLTAADAGATFNAGAVSQSSAVFGSVAWVANAGNDRLWSFDGTTWTQATEDVRRSRLAVANWVFGAQFATSAATIGYTQRVLLGTDPSNPEIYHCVTAPGTSASWVGPNVVGDSAYPIQTLYAAGEAVFAGKPDGVFLIEGGGRMRNLAPHWRNEYDASNGASLYFYDEWLFAAHTQFLDMLSPSPERIGQQNACQPGAYESFENSPIFGRVSAQVTDSGYLLSAFYNTTVNRSYVMAGRRTDKLNLSGRNPMTWYGSEFDCDGRITLLHIIPSVNGGPRWLLIGATNSVGTAVLYAQSLPVEPSPYAAWKRSGAHRFSTLFSCVQSLDDLGDPNSPKNMRYVATVTENAENTRALTVSTSMDGAAAVTQATITTAGRQFTVVDEATVDGVNLEVTLTGTSEATEPLIVRSVKLRGTINDERTVVIEMPLQLGRDLDTNRGTKDPTSPWIKRAQLYSLLEAGPISVTDLLNQTRTVVVEDVQDDEILDDDGVGVTIYATVTMSVLLTNATYGSAVYGFSRFG